MPLHGWDPVTVPGAVSGWVELSRRFGSLPLTTVAAPAISYARDGFLVSPVIADGWARSAKTLGAFDGFAAGFLPGGRAPHAGERFRFEDQAASLEAIADTSGDAFYRGALARAMAADARRLGGLLTEEDLARHRADWVGTLSTGYHGTELHEIPPSGQGLAALMAIGILRHHAHADAPVDSADSLHLQFEAMKLAFADVYRYCADPDYMDVSAEELLDDDYLAARAALIDPKVAAGPGVRRAPARRNGEPVDRGCERHDGLAHPVQLSRLRLRHRGAGHRHQPAEPGRRVRARDGASEPGRRQQAAVPHHHPGVPHAGRGTADGVRRDGRAIQPQGHLQMVLRTVDHDQNPQMASDAPRWRITGGREVAVECGFAPEVLQDLKERGHLVTEESTSLAFGGAQLIWRTEDGYIAGSDHRKDGEAVAY